MTKADHNGVYKLGESQFVIRKGDPLPEGAELVNDGETVTDEPEQERAKGKAPANRARGAAPENRSEG